MAKKAQPHELDAHVAILVEIGDLAGCSDEVAGGSRAAPVRTVGDTTSWAMASRRANGYFWAVVRRRLVRQRRGADVTARFVLAAVVDDLLESGRDSQEVWTELERGWSDKVSRDVLEEFRLRMCA